MNNEQRNSGFSLTEVLLAVGTLAIGLTFVAGVFPVAIHFTIVATERTIAAVVADEAFAKIKLYAVGGPYDSYDNFDPNRLEDDKLTDFNDIYAFPATADINSSDFTYPSIADDISQKKYCWSALCRLTEEHDSTDNPNPPVQVTVFVCRKTNPNLRYYAPPDGSIEADWPGPIKVGVSQCPKDNELRINSGDEAFINDGYTIVDDETGRIYRVLERYKSGTADTILLDRDWDDSAPGSSPKDVWVVPPPLAPGTTASPPRTPSGRCPCIAVYQKVIRF